MQKSIWESFLGAQVRMVDAGGVNTRYVEAGTGDVVILLHGTGGHVEAWAPNLMALAENRRVIALDMVGHGLTDKPDLEYVLTDYTAHLRDFMDALGIETAHFAGLSLGAWVASWLALENPERVTSILNATGGVFRWPEGQESGEARERRAMVGTSSELATLTEETVRRRLHLLFHDPAKCPEELVGIRLALYTMPDAEETLPKLHHMLPYDSPDRIRFSLTEERLRRLTMPVLYLWGEFNPGGSVENATRAASLTPRSELIVLDGVGHWPQWEAPDAFTAAAKKFFDEVEGAS